MKGFSASVRMVTTGVLIGLACPIAAQQGYPNKPIRMIIPYAPGGSTAVVSRLVGQKLTDSWGQPVIVDNQPGGNTIIGTEALTKSPPDGHTILYMTSTHVIIPHLYDKLPFDAIRDFAPVATLVGTEIVLVLHPSLPPNTLQEFIAFAKSKPGQLNYATPAAGGMMHLMSELFNITAGVKLEHVPYKGTGPALTDLLGGQVQLSFNNAFSLIPHIKSGKLKGLAVTGDKRLAALPLMPTFAEAGLPSFQAKFWHGILAPAATPKPIVDKLSAEIAKILAMPDIKEKLYSQGMDVFISTPERFAALLKADAAKYASVIKTANIKLEN